MFCLIEAGEHQIGWVPEKDQAITVEKAYDLLNFHAKIDSINAKKWENLLSVGEFYVNHDSFLKFKIYLAMCLFL